MDAYRKFRLIYSEFGAYKGANGKIATIGGCLEYCGAPYYSAISALKSGSDLSHIFCTESAGIPIKSYTPEVIVHPVLQASNETASPDGMAAAEKVIAWLNALNVLIVGPGLGRDEVLLNQSVSRIIQASISARKVLVIDADGINLLTNQELSLNYPQAILTPNIVEFKRLCRKYTQREVNIEPIESNEDIQTIDISDPNVRPVVELARHMGNIILLKGNSDIITDGEIAYLVGRKGGQKRSGGQGDILTGCIATICFLGAKQGLSLIECVPLACLLTRSAAYLAFKEKGWSLTAPDIILKIGEALNHYLHDDFSSKL